MTKEHRFEIVWDAIEATPSEAASMKARAEVMTAIRKIIDSWNATQTASAKRLGIT
jgi:predicted XRE-type DNA-binding protein